MAVSNPLLVLLFFAAIPCPLTPTLRCVALTICGAILRILGSACSIWRISSEVFPSDSPHPCNLPGTSLSPVVWRRLRTRLHHVLIFSVRLSSGTDEADEKNFRRRKMKRRDQT